MFYQIGQFEEGKGVYAGRCNGEHIWVALKETPKRVEWEVAQAFCREIGGGYRLPTIEELMLIYANRIIISPRLIVCGGEKLNYEGYWSGTENAAYRAIRLNFSNGISEWHEKLDYYCCRPILSEKVQEGE